MPRPNDRNARIALAMGWTWDEKPWLRTKPGAIPQYDKWLDEDLIEKEITHWLNPEGKPAMRPDYVGTLEGVAGLMRELGHHWKWGWNGFEWVCFRELSYDPDDPYDPDEWFRSPDDRPGYCIGDAWMSVFGNEATDGNTEA
ncbi:MAG TPA: hypothetical protein VMX14_03570 [Anaerolineae bacterium]|nr:hypothetical protein [Anaerolineae bacterium]HUW13353.1 hypothetical protein [Anaerolineae bacterium]